MKQVPKKPVTQLEVNESLVGDTIEEILERKKEMKEQIETDNNELVYNDNETNIVSPTTNIRSDKFELMLEQKMDEQSFNEKKHLKIVRQTEDNNTESSTENGTEK